RVQSYLELVLVEMLWQCQLFSLLSVICSTVAELQPHPHIIYGEAVAIAQAPWQVSIQDWYGHFCGGSVHSPSIILTAAHCVSGYSIEHLSVRVGSSYTDFGGFIVGVSLIASHEYYDDYTFNNDVALLLLDESLDLMAYYEIGSIELAKEMPPKGSNASVTGWGLTENGGVPESLQYLETKILDIEQCRKLYSGYSITRNMLCATARDRGTCQGDSGGALVVDSRQVGIVSWGVGCADPQYPAVYTSVPALNKWIEGTAKRL
ncbi:hypothetical protein KR018_008938, partial [Drosophila ironensis]